MDKIKREDNSMAKKTKYTKEDIEKILKALETRKC